MSARMLAGSFLAGIVCLSVARLGKAGDRASEVLSDTIKNARQPQLAVASDGKVFITYGRDNVIYFAVKSDAAHGFSPSIFVARVSQMPLGVRRGSRIAVSGGGLVITAVDGRQGHGKDEDLHAWRSTDGGATWQGPVTINGETASAREGLHHLAASPDGTLYCVWLDLRVKGTRLYGAYSTDGGTVWTERLLYRSPDGSVCQCCQPQVAFDARGGLHVMWRNELAGNRDMYLMNSKDSGRTFDKPIKLGTGTWPLDACPMDGGGLAADAGGNVTTIWRRENDLYRCTPGEREGLLARGMQGWATTGPGGIYLTWITARPGAVMALLPGTQRPIKLAESGSDPVIAAAPNGNGPAVIAWEEPHGGQTNVEIRVVRQ